MDRIEFGKRLISELATAKEKSTAAAERQKDLKKEIEKKRTDATAKIAAARQIRNDQKKEKLGSRIKSGIRDAKYSKASTSTISSKDQGATAMQKGAENVAKVGAATAKNVAKGVGKAVVGLLDRGERANERRKSLDDVKKARSSINRSRAELRQSQKPEPEKTKNKFSPPSVTKKPEQKRLSGQSDNKQISGGAERKALPAAKPRKFGTDPDGTPSKGTLARSSKKIRRGMMQQREEFIQEIEEKEDKKKDKLDKIIDVMRGKNKITINPDVKEEVKTENWKDNYVATEYETVDIIKPEPLNPSDWRKELDSLRP